MVLAEPRVTREAGSGKREAGSGKRETEACHPSLRSG
jgi:hypothetical protein